MRSKSQPDDALPSLNATITALDKTRSDATVPKPAIDAFDAASALLTAIRDSTIDRADYVELGLACAGDCQAIDLRIKSRGDDQLSPSILRVMEQLTTTMTAFQRHIVKRGKRNAASRFLHLRTGHNSLGATIDLSLSSPMFKQLDPNARDLLGVVAFFPQGVNEENLDWLFPTIPDVAATLDTFCVLSLTYRSDGFVTMLVPLRDYLHPKDPLLSPLLSTAKKSYFTRLSAKPELFMPGSKETQWIASEDANVEHLFDVLTSVDTNSDRLWGACINFLNLLYWHKPQQTVLGPKINQLPDESCFKPDCLFWLSKLFSSLGNHKEQKRLLEHALKLESERGNDNGVALVLAELSGSAGSHSEGIRQAKELLEIFERIGDKGKQGNSLNRLAWALCNDEQLDAAEEAAFHAIQLLSEKGQEFWICDSHTILGRIYEAKGEREKAVYHLKATLAITSRFGWNDSFTADITLVMLFIKEGKFEDAHAHLKQARSLAVNNAYQRGYVAILQAGIYLQHHRLEDAMSEVLCASGIFEELGVQDEIEKCRDLLKSIKGATKSCNTLVSVSSVSSII